MSSVGFSLDLIGKLRDEFPETVVGLKDSSGDWSNMEAILEAFPDFDLFPGSEGFLLKGLRQGAAGTISASANINARAMRQVYDAFMNDDVAGAERAQAGLSEFRAVVRTWSAVARSSASSGGSGTAHSGSSLKWAITALMTGISGCDCTTARNSESPAWARSASATSSFMNAS
ncbi:MAG: dihydrodipicolinate synthase family protein, partial [Pseudomonadota bacterium]